MATKTVNQPTNIIYSEQPRGYRAEQTHQYQIERPNYGQAERSNNYQMGGTAEMEVSPEIAQNQVSFDKNRKIKINGE